MCKWYFSNFNELIHLLFLFFRFYTQCMLPKTVDPLYIKRLLIANIREPVEIIEQKQVAKTKFKIKQKWHSK